ncbi:hypothetical protein Pelo_15265 [Pelomyxa schiedti]|nr:hypothetical protein Pelo_15265 [Pelomyxa schiedti]
MAKRPRYNDVARVDPVPVLPTADPHDYDVVVVKTEVTTSSEPEQPQQPTLLSTESSTATTATTTATETSDEAQQSTNGNSQESSTLATTPSSKFDDDCRFTRSIDWRTTPTTTKLPATQLQVVQQEITVESENPPARFCSRHVVTLCAPTAGPAYRATTRGRAQSAGSQ